MASCLACLASNQRLVPGKSATGYLLHCSRPLTQVTSDSLQKNQRQVTCSTVAVPLHKLPAIRCRKTSDRLPAPLWPSTYTSYRRFVAGKPAIGYLLHRGRPLTQVTSDSLQENQRQVTCSTVAVPLHKLPAICCRKISDRLPAPLWPSPYTSYQRFVAGKPAIGYLLHCGRPLTQVTSDSLQENQRQVTCSIVAVPLQKLPAIRCRKISDRLPANNR